MRGKEYTALILADVMDNEKIEEMCAEYEDLYAQLSPFKSSSQPLSAQRSESETNSVVKGVTDTTNSTIAKAQTHGTSESKTHTNTLGGNLNIGSHLGPVSGGVNYSHSIGNTTGSTESSTETKSEGTAKSLTEQNSVAKALSESNGESLQINHENRAVKTLMDRIDEQIKRMRGCEDFGMFDTCAYFAGRAFGKHKLCPVVSPKKTVEGAIGGVLGTMVFGVIATVIYSIAANRMEAFTRTNIGVSMYVIIALLACVAAVLGIYGDLFASVVKRQCGIKDYGTIFPGHGGILDRFDSVMFIAPFVTMVVIAAFYD